MECMNTIRPVEVGWEILLQIFINFEIESKQQRDVKWAQTKEFVLTTTFFVCPRRRRSRLSVGSAKPEILLANNEYENWKIEKWPEWQRQ